MKKQTVIKLAILLILLIILIWINQRFFKLDPLTVKEWILSFGIWSSILYIVLYSIRPLVLFPASILSIAGGLAFGPYLGTLYTMIGATLGAIIAYLAASKLNLNVLKDTENKKVAQLKNQLEKHGFLYVLILRLIPLIHFDLISYAAGVSKVKLLPFAAATFIGIIPGTFAFNFLGSSVVAGDTETIIIACIVFLILLIAPLFFRKRMKELFSNTEK